MAATVLLRRDHWVAWGNPSDARPDAQRKDVCPMRSEPGELRMPPTKIAPSSPHGFSMPGKATESRGSLSSTAAPVDRDHLLDRLHRLRGLLPVFAQELASARRQAATLRVENRGLLEEVRRLRAQHDEHPSARRSRR